MSEKYSEELLKMIKHEEGYAGLNSITIASKHPSTSSNHGAYYDTRKYLTTGFGSLISKAEKGSEKEKADIEKWKKANNNADPFSLTELQAARIMPVDIDKNLVRAMKQINEGREEKIKFETLPENVKKAVVSISYNTGHVGPNTGLAIARAMDTKKKSDWNRVADHFANWHGAKTSEQEAGVLKRRKTEAELIRATIGIEGESDAEDVPYVDNEEQLETPEGGAPQGNGRQPASLGMEQSQPMSAGPMEEPRVPSAFESTQNQMYMQNLEAQKVREQEADEAPLFQGVADFGSHMINSFRTENLITQGANKIVDLTAGFQPQNAMDSKFDPEKQIPDYYERIQGIPPETLKDLLEDSNNNEMFQFRLNQYRVEEQNRNEVVEYMSENPVSGFIGLGIASVLDITSLIPVGKVAKISRIASMAKNLSHTQRAIGGAIGVNLVQDMIQEATLIGNSDIRKFEDGDIIYGAMAATILGGVAGKLKAKSMESKFMQLSEKYHKEKNLMQAEVILEQAKDQNMSPKVIAELEALATVSRQEYTKISMAKAMDKLAEDQTIISKGLMDNAKLDAVKVQGDFVNQIDEQIANLPPTRIQQVIESARTELAEVKQQFQPELNRLKGVEKGLRGKLKRWSSNKTPNSIEKPRYLADLKKSLATIEDQIKDVNSKLKKASKEVDRKKTKEIRSAKKLKDDPRTIELKRLEDAKKAHAKIVRSQYDTKVAMIESGDHPDLQILDGLPALQKAADDLGLGVKFDTVDDMDEYLGLNFKDSTHRSAGAASVKYSGLAKKGSVSEYWSRIPEQTGQVLARALTERNLNPVAGLSSHTINKNSAYAKVVRATSIHKFLTTESAFGRLMLNKSALRHGDNEVSAALYDWLAADNAGRAGAGKLGAFDKAQQIANIYGGEYRTKMNQGVQEIAELAKTDRALSKDLDLTDSNRFLMTKEVMFPEKVSHLVRKEASDAGFSKTNYKPETAAVIERLVKEQDDINRKLLKRAQEAEVVYSNEVYLTDKETGWFSRSWDNDKVREFIAKHGDAKLIELVEVSMERYLIENGVEITDGLRKNLASESKKFAYGLRNVDLEVNKAAKTSMADYLDTLITRDIDGLDTAALVAERDSLRTRQSNSKKKQFAKRKPLDLRGEVTLEDGSTFSMDNLLEDNMFGSQINYIEQMSARIAAAEMGIKDLSELDDLVNIAYEMELQRNKKDSAEFIKRAMSQDIQAFKYGSLATETTGDKAFDRMIRMAKKTQYARLMQYSGVNAIAEVGTLIPEAGYKAMAQAIDGEVMPIMKAIITAGFTGKEFRNIMSDQVSSITGVGLESLSFDALVSSSRTVTKSKTGKVFERAIDNIGKLTKRTSAHVETTIRKVGMNALALDFANIAMDRKSLDSMWGGLSNRNMIEIGMAERLPNGKIQLSPVLLDIQDSIKKYAKDGNGNLAYKSGEAVKDFGIDQWDQKTLRAFGDALTYRANGIFVNSDPTTMKLWMSTPVGSIVNQFRTFANNATSKVAAHNVNNVIEGFKAGELAESAKMAQKLFWSAAMGKLAYVTYGAINEAGREDYAERMEKYLSVTEMRDWTRALGRSSAVTGADTLVDSIAGVAGIDPFFDMSSVGQSRNRFDLLNTPVGQIGTNAGRALQGISEGDLEKTGGALLRLSPLRRQIGINQLINSMGID